MAKDARERRNGGQGGGLRARPQRTGHGRGGIGPLSRIVGLALLGSAALSVPAAAQSGGDLARYLWRERPLLVFGPETGDPRVQSQIAALLPVESDLAERDMALLLVTPGAVATLFGPPAGAASASGLRARFDVGREAFRVVLVGKDGGAKLVSESPVAAEAIFARIDGMPMRRREMRQDAAPDE